MCLKESKHSYGMPGIFLCSTWLAPRNIQGESLLVVSDVSFPGDFSRNLHSLKFDEAVIKDYVPIFVYSVITDHRVGTHPLVGT